MRESRYVGLPIDPSKPGRNWGDEGPIPMSTRASTAMYEVTRILRDIENGDPNAAEQLPPLVYDEPRKLAAQKFAHQKAYLRPGPAPSASRLTLAPGCTPSSLPGRAPLECRSF
jgi:hypothetical protein